MQTPYSPGFLERGPRNDYSMVYRLKPVLWSVQDVLSMDLMTNPNSAYLEISFNALILTTK